MLRFQYGTSKEIEIGKGGRRYLPYVFTEQGIAMLSAVLRSEVAVQVSIKIMNIFVEMRRFLTNNPLMFEQINEIEVRQLEYQKSTDKKYPILEVKYTGVFHDRFLIVDEKLAYHIGASMKDAGKKCFGINKIEDVKIIKDILERLKLENE